MAAKLSVVAEGNKNLIITTTKYAKGACDALRHATFSAKTLIYLNHFQVFQL